MIFTLEPDTNVNPLWWRIPAWTAMVAVSAAQTHDTGHRIAVAVLMTVAALALQFIGNERVRVRQASLLTVTVLGLAACLVGPNGVAEVLVLVAATRAPSCIAGRELIAFTVLNTVAFGATVYEISHHHLPAALAGLAIPLIVQRSIEQQAIVRERDRAQALLAEVQAGREAETQAAALQERGRIAREMHDVLAHSLAGLSVQLQGVRAVAAREGVGPKVLEPLDRAAELAREGLTEARSVVGALRDPVGLGIAELPALVARHPGHATLATVGTPGSVTPEAGHAVYRAVQESLTNAARYAPGSPVAVTVTWAGPALHVLVADDGPAPGRTAVTGQGTGLGLAGMDERVRQVGGTLQAGPRDRAGWQITIEVPTT